MTVIDTKASAADSAQNESGKDVIVHVVGSNDEARFSLTKSQAQGMKDQLAAAIQSEESHDNA
jgi:hypothetical protein